MDKKFMTYEDQIKFLSEEKGLIINDVDAAKKLLKHHSYFALINGYKHPFKNKEGMYKARTTIEDIYQLYSFDNELRYILMQNIMSVEIHLKSLLSYVFSLQYGENELAYLSAINYNYGNPVYQTSINKLIGILTNILADYNSYPYMKHQKKEHNNVPLWVMIKALTLGNISKMYSCQKPQIQTKISKEFTGVSEGDLESFLDLLTRFRNVCAHNERLFDYRYNKGSINNTDIHKQFNIPKKNGRYTEGKSDFFAALIALKYLLSKDKFDLFLDQIKNAIDDLIKKTAQIKREQLYKFMGLPIDWLDLKTMKV